jgi:hypothetical protein
MLDQIEATMLAQVQQNTIQLPDRTGDMMNKRYEWIVALLPELETALAPFTTPLFWWPVVQNSDDETKLETLHFIDMSAPPYSLQPCAALAEMSRIAK